jgi:hypothetical protein
MAAYKLWVAGSHGGWFLAGKLLMQSVVILGKAATGGVSGLGVAFNGIISLLGAFLKKGLLVAGFSYAATAITTGIQAWTDRLNTLSGDAFCGAEGGWLHVSGC